MILYKFSIERIFVSSLGRHVDVLHSGETKALTPPQARKNGWKQASVFKRRKNIGRFFVEFHDRQEYRCKVWEVGQAHLEFAK